MTIDKTALKRLEQYDFPGNVRELENMIERAIVVGNDKVIRLKDLPFDKEMTGTSYKSLEDLERQYILEVLNRHDWNISRSAKVIKVDRVTLYNKIKKYNLKSQKNRKH